MADPYLGKYELKIENLPWINSNRDQKQLEFVLNIDFPFLGFEGENSDRPENDS